jgi:hypothetical protein
MPVGKRTIVLHHMLPRILLFHRIPVAQRLRPGDLRPWSQQWLKSHGQSLRLKCLLRGIQSWTACRQLTASIQASKIAHNHFLKCRMLCNGDGTSWTVRVTRTLIHGIETRRWASGGC